MIRVEAMDDDVGSNAVLRYSIPYGAEDKFAIDNILGIIRVNGLLDFEASQSFTFVVRVTDSGTPSMNASVEVVVNIVNLNDNNPIFTEATYRSTIRGAENGHFFWRYSSIVFDSTFFFW